MKRKNKLGVSASKRTIGIKPVDPLMKLREKKIKQKQWGFNSKAQDLRVVVVPSDMAVDEMGRTRKIKGFTVSFKYGRYVTSNPSVVDGLLTHPSCHKSFKPTFNEDNYIEWRLKDTGMDKPQDTDEDMWDDNLDVVDEEVNINEESEELEEFNFEPDYTGDEDVDEEFFGEDYDEDDFTEPDEIEAEVVEESHSSSDAKIDALSEKMDVLVGAITKLVESNTKDKGYSDEEEIDEVNEHPTKKKKTYKCQKCGQDNFDSPAEVRKHRQNGECARNLRKQLMRKSSGPKVIDGPLTT